MTKGDISRDERNAVLLEHKELTRHVADLDDWALPETPRDGDWGPELGRRAGHLVEELKRHFSGDAEGRFFAEVAARSPHLLGKLSSLTKEHSQILEAFQEVTQSALALSPTDSATASRVAAQARRAVAFLRRHEAEENELIFNAFWVDLGVGD